MANRTCARLPTLTLAALLGCGASPVITVTPTPIAPAPAPVSYLQLNGNWEALATPPAGTAILSSPVAGFTGALQSVNGEVAGTFRALTLGANPLAPCVALTQDLAATGTLDSTNHLSLTVPLAGGIATLAVTLSQDLHSFANGTYAIVGGPCAMTSTPMAIVQFAPLIGTYTGTVTGYPAAGAPVTVTAVLTQSLTPNADGVFPLAGKITVSGACATTLSFTDGTVSGNGIDTFSALTPLLASGVFHGAMVPDATTIQASVFLYSPLCSTNSFVGTLTRQ